jgi:hypothetical protein
VLAFKSVSFVNLVNPRTVPINYIQVAFVAWISLNIKAISGCQKTKLIQNFPTVLAEDIVYLAGHRQH